MFREILIFDDKEIKNNIFHCYAGPLNLDDLYGLDDITEKVSEYELDEFFLLMRNFWNIIIISGVMYAKVLTKNLIPEPICNHKFLKAKLRSGKNSTVKTHQK